MSNYNENFRIIDNAIKKIWCKEIKMDYENYSLLKEDSLKNSFYYHLRTKLTDSFLQENNMRIYTEFYLNGIRADLVIAKICVTIPVKEVIYQTR